MPGSVPNVSLNTLLEIHEDKAGQGTGINQAQVTGTAPVYDGAG